MSTTVMFTIEMVVWEACFEGNSVGLTLALEQSEEFNFFFFFENELILQSKAEDTKGKPTKQEREAYQIEQLDLKMGG